LIDDATIIVIDPATESLDTVHDGTGALRCIGMEKQGVEDVLEGEIRAVPVLACFILRGYEDFGWG